MKKTFLALLTMGFVLAACNESEAKKEAPEAKAAEVSAPAAQAKPSEPNNRMAQVKTIDWATAEEMAKNGALYLDVRMPDELMKGYVPHAKNIPMNELPNRVSELPKDRDILVYCRSGRRSEASTNWLMKQGFDRVYNVAGGYLAYPGNK